MAQVAYYYLFQRKEKANYRTDSLQEATVWERET